MQDQRQLGVNFKELFNPKVYKEFQQGDFVNQPSMSGYFFIFHDVKKPKICVIVNTSENAYPGTTSILKGWVFIVFNVRSFDDYINNFENYYFPQIVNIVDENTEDRNERNLPYGYYLDREGKLRVDARKAEEVRKIYKMYADNPSIRYIAAEFNTNFSFIREILHANSQYEQMHPIIVTSNLIKQVRDTMAGNIKGGRIHKQTTQELIDDVRRQGKEIRAKAGLK